MKPRLFIGSSVESLNVAYAVQEELEHSFLVTVWSQGIFDLSSNTLDTLIASLDKFDGALFVFSPEDEVKLRGATVKTVRDNVLFEFGLFIGRLGRNRCFFLMPRGVDNFHLPSDLIGSNPGTYEANRPDGNLQAAVGPVCNKIRTQLSQVVERPYTHKTEPVNVDSTNTSPEPHAAPAKQEFFSCFISSSSSDRQFALALRDFLKERGVNCWFPEDELLPGYDLHTQLAEGLQSCDKVLLCASERWLSSEWANTDIALALEKERQIHEKTGKQSPVLLPLVLDNFLYNGWQNDNAESLKSRVYGNFKDWATDNEKRQSELERLIKALRIKHK